MRKPQSRCEFAQRQPCERDVDLEFLSRQSARILDELRLIRQDVAEIKTRLTALEGAFGLLRLNRFEERIEKLEGELP